MKKNKNIVEEKLTDIARASLLDSNDAKRLLSSYGGSTHMPKNIVRNSDSISDYLVNNDAAFNRGTVKASLILDIPEVSAVSRRLSSYERCVLDAIMTVWHDFVSDEDGVDKTPFFTAGSLYRRMYGVSKPDGSSGKVKINRQCIDEIDAAVRKLMSCTLEIILPPELLKEGTVDKRLESALAPLVRMELELRGTHYKSNGYKIVSEPILYTYGMWTNTLVTSDISVFHFPDCISRTAYNLGTRNLLDFRAMVAVADDSSTAYLDFGVVYAQRNANTSVQKKRARSVVTAFLDDWLASGLISSYDFIFRFDSATPSGVVIVIPEDKRCLFLSSYIRKK